ncbi:MAG: TRAP transporter small permease [Clostridiales Family XIII bacterium]|jgi:TRAP-type C4-dicarboxylate transport system permease small subunit|nr:TRAP transporter small permease [Clostridiales Family XIII bacterium]
MNALKKCGKIIAEGENWLSIVMFVAMIAVVMAIVICRYVLEVRFTAGEEIARYLMIWCGYAGTMMGFREHSHVGIVVFAEMFPLSWRPKIIRLRHILSTAVVIFLFYVALMCLNEFVASGKLTTATRIPTAAVYAIIPIAMVFSIAHTIADIANDYAPGGAGPPDGGKAGDAPGGWQRTPQAAGRKEAGGSD